NVNLPIEPVNTKNADAIDYFCRQKNIELIVNGPEDPLSQGLADRLQKPGGVGGKLTKRWVFGPVQAGARLEGDKAWSKQHMRAARLPTADARIFPVFAAARKYHATREPAVVV